MRPLIKSSDCLYYILSRTSWGDGPRHKVDLYYDAPISGQILIKDIWYEYMAVSFRKNGDRLYLLYLKDKVVGTFTLEMWS